MTQHWTNSWWLRGLVAGLVLVSTGLTASGQVPEVISKHNWSAAGSTGVADEDSAAAIRLDTASASIRTTAPAQTVAVLRYPVAGVVGSEVNFYVGWVFNDNYTLSLTFQKNDDQAYAAATLKKVRLSDGFTTSMSGVNSMAAAASPSPQTATRTFACSGVCFNTKDFAYYVEVVLWKPLATSDPKVFGLSVVSFF
jgi:hypothetical protein